MRCKTISCMARYHISVHFQMPGSHDSMVDLCIIKWKPWMDIQLLDTTSWRERFFESNLCQSMPGGMRVLVFSPVKQTTSVRLKPSEP